MGIADWGLGIADWGLQGVSLGWGCGAGGDSRLRGNDVDGGGALGGGCGSDVDRGEWGRDAGDLQGWDSWPLWVCDIGGGCGWFLRAGRV